MFIIFYMRNFSKLFLTDICYFDYISTFFHPYISLVFSNVNMDKLLDSKPGYYKLSRNEYATIVLDYFSKHTDYNKFINWYELSGNPNAIYILEKNIDKIRWCSLSTNKNAIHLLEQNMDKIDWSMLSYNENAIHILERNIDKINWPRLCRNPNAISIIEKNMDKINIRQMLYENKNAMHIFEKFINDEKYKNDIDWVRLARNHSSISIFEKHIYEVIDLYPRKNLHFCHNDEIEDLFQSLCRNPNAIDLIQLEKEWEQYWNWEELSRNRSKKAMKLLEQNQDCIHWKALSQNPYGISILEKNIDKICWQHLTGNPNALSLLEQNQDKISWQHFSKNPLIINFLLKINRDKTIRLSESFNDELVTYIFNPDRISNLSKIFNVPFQDVLQSYSLE